MCNEFDGPGTPRPRAPFSPKIPADAVIIPGHGKISSREDIVAGINVLKQMQTVVEAAVQAGKTLE
jgi:hypothetical protein